MTCRLMDSMLQSQCAMCHTCMAGRVLHGMGCVILQKACQLMNQFIMKVILTTPHDAQSNRQQLQQGSGAFLTNVQRVEIVCKHTFCSITVPPLPSAYSSQNPDLQ